MPLFDPPKQFVDDLQRYDHALRVVWSDHRECWLIERKVSRGKVFAPPQKLDPDDATPDLPLEQILEHNRTAYDEWRAASDGYMIVLEVDKECLDSRVFFTLWDSDIWAQGGADAVNERIDKAYHAAARKGREEFLDFVRQEARARWRYMHRPRLLPEDKVHTAPEGGMF
jgi:hypothetical protein